MRHTINVITVVKKIVIIAAVFFALGFGFANATFIDFDDLPYDPDYPLFYSHPVADQYISQGVLFDDAYLRPYNEVSESVISPPNYLLSAVSMGINFFGCCRGYKKDTYQRNLSIQSGRN